MFWASAAEDWFLRLQIAARQDESTRELAPCPPAGGLILRQLAAIAIAVSTALAALAGSARADSLPGWWVKEAMCIHSHESIDWHLGGPSVDRGGMQIDIRTWSAFAPPGFPRVPEAATPHQQLVVSYLVWLKNGNRFGGNQWPTSAALCSVA
jgi:hypothetical protein